MIPTTNAVLEQQLDRTWELINSQQAKPAMEACQQLNQNYPDSDDGWFATSFLAFQLRNGPLALACIDKAIQLNDQNVQWQLHKAHTLTILASNNRQYRQQAQALLRPLCDQNHQDPDFCAELALVLNKLEQFEPAAYYYQRALDLTPQQSNYHQWRGQLYFNLGSIQRYLGKIDQALTSLDQAIKYNFGDCEAHLLRSSLKKQTPQSNHVEQLQQLISQLNKRNSHPLALTQAHYALAKELEDLQQYPESFTALHQGASIRRQHMRYEVNHDINTIKQIIQSYDQATFDRQITGCPSEQPIFILGLPRTGSTLIERIIGNHSEVYSAGELNNFALQMTALCRQDNKIDLVKASRDIDFAQLGQNYLDSVEIPDDQPQNAKFIDKLPLNSLYVGLIHLALPQAKIIHVKRHPLDTCYAIYKQLFTNGYPFSYQLEELADYYVAHHRLMEHWRKVMPGVIYEVNYEDVIADVQVQAKGLIDYCQLQWQDRCSEFTNNQAPSTTASASQVRQGIYTSSKNRWQHYAQQLTGVKDILNQAGISCD